MTVIQHKPVNPIAHLSAEDIETLGKELDAIRDRVLAERGESDATYIRKVIKTQRTLEVSSRAVLLFSLFPPAWVIGTAGLTVAKILENMEIGHNILHGQYDFMRDPKIHSTTWEWDHVSPAEQWKHSHNQLHHTYTNVLGKDNDLGYGIMRVDEDQKWYPMHLGQPLWNFLNACFFEYGIAAYDLELGRNLRKGRHKTPEFRGPAARGRPQDPPPGAQGLRHPPAAVRSVLPQHPGRHLHREPAPQPVEPLGDHVRALPQRGRDVFQDVDRGETRGEWYLRQMLGSANISGSRLMHIMTGNLSFQIEHHLFPDLPSKRYQEIAPQVRELFDRYGLRYTTGPLPKQVASAWWKVIRLSLPNRAVARPGTDERPSRALAASGV